MSRHVIAMLLLLAVGGCETMPGSKESSPKNAQHITITPDKLEWEAAPAGLPAGAQVAVLEGDPHKSGFFAMRIKLPANYRIAPHTHPAWERVTVISGTMYLGEGETFNEARAVALPQGTYTSMSPGMRHYAYFKAPTELLVATNGPWGINYVNPADDPRKQAGK